MRTGARLTLLAGKLIGAASRVTGAGGGTTLPGRAARRLYPRFVGEMVAGLPGGCALVTGTNGKTTTATL
ncbi:MAG: DUF1727 domain-containing protein, partial [Gemmatimonadetes bacterium]|nr:DUF1727 domain-containing protein [Gemmatimonadota bacterium]